MKINATCHNYHCYDNHMYFFIISTNILLATKINIIILYKHACSILKQKIIYLILYIAIIMGTIIIMLPCTAFSVNGAFFTNYMHVATPYGSISFISGPPTLLLALYASFSLVSSAAPTTWRGLSLATSYIASGL